MADDGGVLLMLYGLLLLTMFLVLLLVLVWFIFRCHQCAFSASILPFSHRDSVRGVQAAAGKRAH